MAENAGKCDTQGRRLLDCGCLPECCRRSHSGADDADRRINRRHCDLAGRNGHGARARSGATNTGGAIRGDATCRPTSRILLATNPPLGTTLLEFHISPGIRICRVLPQNQASVLLIEVVVRRAPRRRGRQIKLRSSPFETGIGSLKTGTRPQSPERRAIPHVAYGSVYDQPWSSGLQPTLAVENCQPRGRV
jgi:hypothetical protein